MLRGKAFVECFSMMKANSLKNICFLKLYLLIYGCGGSLCVGFSPVAASGSYSLVAVLGLLTVVASLVEHGL